ncbi:MAG: hypothetical protein ACOH5I_02735 [Oligoflexus sp.]
MKACILFIATSLSSAVIASDVSVKLLHPHEWSEDEQKQIMEATAIAFSRMLRADVANCAYRNSFRENKDQLRKLWGSQIPVLNKTKNVEIEVRRTADKVLGKAPVGVAKIDRRQYQVYNLKIYLNQEMLHQHLRADKSLDPNGIWTNTIAHEVAHNFGHMHGSGGTWDRDYPGFFPTELGYCVMSDGKTGSKGK